MNYKLIVGCLIFNGSIAFGMEHKIEDDFASAVAHDAGSKLGAPVFFESQEKLVGGQVRSMLASKTSFYRKPPKNNKTHEAIIKIADALDQQTKLNEVNAKKDRRNSCLLNCCTTAIALGGLGLSIFSTYWAMTYHQKVS